ncbi:hypothetical protein ACWKW9_12130 [Rhizobium daejeonense]
MPTEPLDGGIRRGTDIVKTLTILQTELEATLALLGRQRLADIDRSVFWAR